MLKPETINISILKIKLEGVLITHEALDWSLLKQYTHKDTYALEPNL
jgi:hypothetical protein